MLSITNEEKTFLRPQLFVLALAGALSLYGCGESGPGEEQQSQATAPETTTSPAPEPEPMEAPAMTEVPEATEAPATPAAPEPETTGATEMTEAPAAAAAEEQVAAATEAAEPASVDGGKVYYTYCAVCHKTGLNAAPKYGNKALWIKRIAQGREVMYKHAIEGLRGMPPRGGIPGLSDAEVKAAVDFMVKGSGGWGDS